MESPAIIFEEPLSREQKFAPEVLKQCDVVLEPLFNWIRSHLNDNSNVTADAKQLGKLSNLQILELFLGKWNSDNSEPSVQRLKDGVSSTKGTKDITPVLQPVTYEAIVHPKYMAGIQVDKLALIICEALNQERGHKLADEILGHVLNGYHATRSTSTQSNPDHTNPI